MTTQTIDTHAATNPAFAALVLREFAAGYQDAAASATPFVLLFLPLPLVTASYVRQQLTASNRATGLLAWVARYPEARIGLQDEVVATVPYTRRAIQFALQFGLLQFDESGFVPSSGGLKRKPRIAFPATTEVGEVVRLSDRLGYGAGSVGDSFQTLSILGVTP